MVLGSGSVESSSERSAPKDRPSQGKPLNIVRKLIQGSQNGWVGSMLTHRVADGRAAPRHRNSGFGVRVSPRGWGGSLLCGSWGSQRFVRVGIQTHSVHSGDTSSSLTMKLASPLLCLLLIVLAAFAFSGTEAKLREGECEGGLTLIYRVVDFLWRLSTETSSRWWCTRSHSVHAPNVWWKWLFYVCRPRSLPESHRTGSAETH